MNEIHELERLAIEAIEHLTDPTFPAIVDYIRERRRVWIFTHARILIAVIRLESNGLIEARRVLDVHGNARWCYRPTYATNTAEQHGSRCSDCGPPAPGARGAGAPGLDALDALDVDDDHDRQSITRANRRRRRRGR